MQNFAADGTIQSNMQLLRYCYDIKMIS